MKLPIKLSLIVLIISGLVLATANVSSAESWTERATNAVNQAREVVEAAGEAADAKARKALQQAEKALKQAEQALEAAGEAAEAQVQEILNQAEAAINQAGEAVEAAGKAGGEQAQAILQQGQEALNQAGKAVVAAGEVAQAMLDAYEAADKATEAAALETFESVKENATALKEKLEAKGAEAKEIVEDSANACKFLAEEARKQVEGVLQETAAAIETKRKAVGDRVQEAHDRASAAGEALLTVAALYAQAEIRGNAQDATTGIQLTEMLRKGDIQGAKQLSMIAAQNAAIDSFKNPAFAEMQLNIEQSFQNEMRQMEFNLALQNEIIIQNALNVNAEGAATPGALPDTKAAEKVYAEMAYQEMLKNPEMVALLTDEAAMNNAAMVYYEAARAYAEEVFGIKLPPASKVFKKSEETAKGAEKDAEKERRKQKRLRGPRIRRRTVHIPCYHR